MVPIPFLPFSQKETRPSEDLMLEVPGELEETQGPQEALGSFRAI